MTMDMDRDRIRPYEKNPFYWQYKNRPVLLLGGSVEDNLFQIADVERHLDLLSSVGGNYVRCTMSSRDPGDVWPFEKDESSGLYDLEKPGREYWRRFERFLKLTSERDIILQIEMWDRFDYARGPWRENPFNPKNNVNFTVADSSLKENIDTHPARKENAFFRSVPALENNELVLKYQHAHADRILERSLQYPNVLYCMDNETNESPLWGAYWSEYIRARAKAAGVGAETTEMWDPWDLHDPMHANTYDHPELYSFVDISQNNHNCCHQHWVNALDIRRKIVESGRIRPLTTVKTYGANTGHFGRSRDGQERFWRHIFAGVAAVRFHRPPSGLGLSELACAHIKSARMLSDSIDIFSCEPARELLGECSLNEAFCTARVSGENVEYAVFFTDGGDTLLDVSACESKTLTLRWLDIVNSRWLDEQEVVCESPLRFGENLRLVTPQEFGYWAVVVKPHA